MADNDISNKTRKVLQQNNMTETELTNSDLRDLDQEIASE